MSTIRPQQTPPSREEIALCAYLLWEKEGRPHGRHVTHWMQAEEQLLADFAQDNGLLDPGAAAQLELQKFHSQSRRKQKTVRSQ